MSIFQFNVHKPNYRKLVFCFCLIVILLNVFNCISYIPLVKKPAGTNVCLKMTAIFKPDFNKNSKEPYNPFLYNLNDIVGYTGFSSNCKGAPEKTIFITIKVKGLARSKEYKVFGGTGKETHYGIAIIEGTIALKMPNKPVKQETFSGGEDISFLTTSRRGPRSAPFEKAMNLKGSLTEKILNLLAEEFGSELIIRAYQGRRNKELSDTALRMLIERKESKAVPYVLKDLDRVAPRNQRPYLKALIALGDKNAAMEIGKILINRSHVANSDEFFKALIALGDVRSIGHCIKFLEKIHTQNGTEKEKAKAREAAIQAMKKISGQNFGTTLTKWKKWCAGNKCSYE